MTLLAATADLPWRGDRGDRRLLQCLGLAPPRPFTAVADPRTGQLFVFALLLTRIDAGFAGRAYAAYGGVYITASLGWLWLVEGLRPDRWDALGGAIALLGGAIILFGPRAT